MVFSLYHHGNKTLYYEMTGRHQLQVSRYNVLRSRPSPFLSSSDHPLLTSRLQPSQY